MRVRNNFVSNSSSSSYIIALDSLDDLKRVKDGKEIKKLLTNKIILCAEDKKECEECNKAFLCFTSSANPLLELLNRSKFREEKESWHTELSDKEAAWLKKNSGKTGYMIYVCNWDETVYSYHHIERELIVSGIDYFEI